ncbi:hypothetical protein BST81_15760 [Leptolyngbya sp. 'hensonii']|uniref:hypothetical protein n=1 Tax=Leptolyngbya sp. 'hensonii' TaxID=1922337 RepID=UPI00094FE711|nr:hypothetical protein [Leptolyngbya sp. 'hensonii']OLP17274.1 hypothetical protein BST81_15760 [Leptolyngbya sp. 'hensonii']
MSETYPENQKKKIIIISFTNLASDPRVNRQIHFLQNHYQIISVGRTRSELDNIEFIQIPQKRKSLLLKLWNFLQLLLRKYEPYYWQKSDITQSLEKLSDIQADLILANDIDTLPLALKLAKPDTKVIFDAHEYAPLQFEDRLIFRIFFQHYRTYLCKTYIPQVDGMITVCQSIADRYEQDTGVCPLVITNAPDYEEIQPQLRSEPAAKIRLVHHGAAIVSRKLENMIRVMDHLDSRFELTFLLTNNDPAYLNHLQRLAATYPNISFLPPVPMRTLPQYLNQFDIGLFLLEPINFNYRHALPNKLFEFIQARLAIAIGPSIEMARIVQTYGCGLVAENFSPAAMATALMRLDRQKINDYKQRSHQIAHSMSSETNQKNLLGLVRSVLNH